MVQGRVEALRPALLSVDKVEVLGALSELGELLRQKEADSTLLPWLLPLLIKEDEEIRRAASWNVGKMAQNRSIAHMDIGPLLAAMKDVDAEVRENAAWALGELAGMNVGGMESLPLLIDLLGDEETQTRGMAAWALGRLAERMGLADETSVGRLQSLRTDRSQYVSKTADWTLERILPLLAKPPVND
jgi:HEAT repeat protein